MSTWTFIKCSSVSFVVDLSIRVPKRSHLRRSLMKLHVFLAKLFPFLAIRVFSLLYILSPQSLSCWRCHTYYLHFSKTIFLLVPRNSFMFSLPSLYDWGFFFWLVLLLLAFCYKPQIANRKRWVMYDIYFGSQKTFSFESENVGHTCIFLLSGFWKNSIAKKLFHVIVRCISHKL